MAVAPKSQNRALSILILAVLLLVPKPCFAAGEVNAADTAWVLVASALVLFMTIPGLFLFYAGLVAKRNVLSLMMQCLALTACVSLLWLFFGYSVAFDTSGMVTGELGLHAFLGSSSKALLVGVGRDAVWGTIPESLFFLYQMTFAIITPALMIGAFAERMKFSAVLAFSLLWVVVVYLPICHMVWGGPGAVFADLGVIDFAGGIVVHITAGIGALVACMFVGKRDGFPEQVRRPHNMTMTVTGTAMLWVGWFGFNGGSALAAGSSAAMAIVVTHLSACVGTLVWMVIEWLRNDKPSVLGAATGSIAGLAAITPAAGCVGPVGALAIGLLSGAVCYWASIFVKARFRYDDSLDVFGVHGVGGIVGTLSLAVFGSPALGGNIPDYDFAHQLGAQCLGAGVTAVYSAGASFLILLLVKAFLGGLRVTQQQEREGLDLTEHEELGYDL
jgi:Amt family ammonium transporter